MKTLSDRKLPLIAAAAVLLGLSVNPAPAAEAEFKPLMNKLVRTRCHMDICGWYSIDEAKVVGTSPKGVLYELKIKTWESHHKNGKYDRPAPRTDESSATQFIFCSKQKPAFIESDDAGKWTATLLQPGNESVMAGATESAYAEYWAACHNAAVKDVYDQGTRLARKLGYRFSGDAFLDDVKLGAPSDVLKW